MKGIWISTLGKERKKTESLRNGGIARRRYIAFDPVAKFPSAPSSQPSSLFESLWRFICLGRRNGENRRRQEPRKCLEIRRDSQKYGAINLIGFPSSSSQAWNNFGGLNFGFLPPPNEAGRLQYPPDPSCFSEYGCQICPLLLPSFIPIVKNSSHIHHSPSGFDP